MKLTEQQKKDIAKKLDEIWKRPRSCPVCKHNLWAIQDNIFEVREFNAEKFVVGGLIIPLIVVMCENCSNTLFFSAIRLGVVSRQPLKSQ